MTRSQLGALVRNLRTAALRTTTTGCTLRKIQTPAQPQTRPQERLNITFFVNKHNSLSQRVAEELKARNHKVQVCEVENAEEMVVNAKMTSPDMIFCPFLTLRVPEEVWADSRVPCLIVHPGIEGDRGMSSLDWALKEGERDWGVTVLQAAEEMDMGDVWSTQNFSIHRENINTLTKSSLYSNEVTYAAVENCLRTIENFTSGTQPRPLDYSKQHIRGRLRTSMKNIDRKIDWEKSSEEVARIVRMSDTAPGALAHLKQKGSGNEGSKAWRVFGASIEEQLPESRGAPGEIIGQRDNAILVKCGAGSVWLSHLKKDKLKLPATYWLKDLEVPVLPSPPVEVPHGTFPRTFQEIWTTVSPDGICSVNFEFYNGAMSTAQCRRLSSVLQAVERDDRVKVVVLKGGYNFYSNGIHLNVIEDATDPALEAWNNINAINDIVRNVFTSKKVTITAMQGNAGAGGVMMALASDLTWSRDGVVLNPHYRLMHLFGSEYHTYFLPQRVGRDKAEDLLSSAAPLLSREAVNIGLVHSAYGNTVQEFSAYVDEKARYFASNKKHQQLIRMKNSYRSEKWLQMLEKHRENENLMMRKSFHSQEFHNARKYFVYH
ncbi:LOW QUALITY PROTEIN: hydrogenase maturation factor HoxX-like [Nematostella vectensis]|uniref:LOW QUALITY PROTEIN: hydrogenase maturation factor HoxX-like n=1 Tax=Nematostella vectensis TaxID=45351 RepID=UPI00138FF2DA|nr:LOW QUALITY PROTEIN: hydrogenase maturation factor HoxX-like [Nematostella vectensis]